MTRDSPGLEGPGIAGRGVYVPFSNVESSIVRISNVFAECPVCCNGLENTAHMLCTTERRWVIFIVIANEEKSLCSQRTCWYNLEMFNADNSF